MQTKDGRRVSILKERSMAIIQSEQRGGKKRKRKKPEVICGTIPKSKPICNRYNQSPIIRSESDGTGLQNAGVASGASLYWDIPIATGTKADTFVR